MGHTESAILIDMFSQGQFSTIYNNALVDVEWITSSMEIIHPLVANDTNNSFRVRY